MKKMLSNSWEIPYGLYMSEIKPIINCEDVWFRYEDDQKWILEGVSLAINPGEFVAIIGQNGAGKTTLVKHFNSILKPLKGNVFIQQQNSRDIPFQKIASLVGYSYQNPDHQIFNVTVLDEIKFGPRHVGMPEEEIETRVDQVLETVGLQDHKEEYPFSLGRGERQKLAVGSILAMNPDVMVIDEPTTGLDWRGGVAMMELISKLHSEGRTIVMITHDMRIVSAFAERVVVMAQGKILMDGLPEEIFAAKDILSKAFLEPPQITRITQALSGFGLPSNLLTVEDTVEAIKKVLEK